MIAKNYFICNNKNVRTKRKDTKMDLLKEIEKKVELTDKEKFAVGMILADLTKDKNSFEYFKNRYNAN